VLKELGEEVLVFREGDHAVADVAWGQHVEVFAEAAGRATVIGDGDDGGEVADDAGKVVEVTLGATIGARLKRVWGRNGDGAGGQARGGIGGAAEGGGSGDVALESAEDGGKASAASDGNDPQGGRGVFVGWARSGPGSQSSL
jgi:hypothetical protein